MVDIFDEVDEELRADKAQAVLKQYGGLILAAAFAVVLGVAGWQGWQWWQTRQDQAAAAHFLAAMRIADNLSPTPGLAAPDNAATAEKRAQALTGQIAAVASSPKIDDSLTHLDNSLRQLDQILADVKPKIGTLATKLNQAADQAKGAASAARGVLGGDGANQDQSLADVMRQIDQAARSIRSLADYLGRHPEAVINGKPKETR